MEKIKKTVFNSGFLRIECADDSTGFSKIPIPFGEETVTENRFNAAFANGDRIEKVVHIPFHKNVPRNAYVFIGGDKFTIWKQQEIKTSNPPIIVLTLKAST